MPTSTPQGAGGGDLLALYKVHGQVVGDLAREQADGAHVGLFHIQVFDHSEGARRTDGPADIQLSRLDLHELHVGILNIAPHVALVVRYSKHGAQQGGRP